VRVMAQGMAAIKVRRWRRGVPGAADDESGHIT